MLAGLLPAAFNVTRGSRTPPPPPPPPPLVSSPAHPYYYVAKLENVVVNGTILPDNKVGPGAMHRPLPTNLP